MAKKAEDFALSDEQKEEIKKIAEQIQGRDYEQVLAGFEVVRRDDGREVHIPGIIDMMEDYGIPFPNAVELYRKKNAKRMAKPENLRGVCVGKFKPDEPWVDPDSGEEIFKINFTFLIDNVGEVRATDWGCKFDEIEDGDHVEIDGFDGGVYNDIPQVKIQNIKKVEKFIVNLPKD